MWKPIFSLQTSDGTPVPGTSWLECRFHYLHLPPPPTHLFDDTHITRLTGAEAAALGGTPLGEPTHRAFYTVPEPFDLKSTAMLKAESRGIYESIQLYISFLPR